MKKKLLITAGGTATAWHICSVIRENFSNDFEIYLVDSNPKYLVAASTLADFFYQVPLIYKRNYKKVMINLIKKYKIDIIIPLIDFDLEIFAEDSELIKKLKLKSTGPSLLTFKTLANKKNMNVFLNKNNLPTIPIYDLKEIKNNKEYFVKPKIGFGSKNLGIIKGEKITRKILNDNIVQDLAINKGECEITAEIFNSGNDFQILSRKRVETKAGVCTKMEIVEIIEIRNAIKKLIKIIDCPVAMCVQFLKHNNRWCITDCNLRLGAGTALSSVAGFELVKALLKKLLNQETKSCFHVNKDIKSVLRVYKEIVIK